MEKKKKKRKISLKGKIFLLVLFTIIGIFLLYIFNASTRNIIILGNEYYTDDQIIETAKIENYPTFVLLSKQGIKSKLKKLELIKDVKVHKKLGFILEIEVIEKKILYLRRSSNEYVLSDGKTIVLNNISGYPVLLNHVEEDIEKKFIEKLSDIDTNVIRKISEIEYNNTELDNERFIFYMNDGNKIFINIPKLNVMNKYEEIVSKFNGKRGILNLDSGNYLEVKN